MQRNSGRFAFFGLLSAGCLAAPVGAQTVTPSSGVWSTTTSGATVTTSTVTVTTPPPFIFSFGQPTSSGSFPATVSASLMGVGNSATNTYTYNGPIYQFIGAGTQGSTSIAQQGYIVGPAFSASIAAGAGLWNTGASFAPPSTSSVAGTPALLTVISNGADGAVDPKDNKKPGGGSYNAGAGGSVSITQNQNVTLLLSVANTAIPSGVTLTLNPWTPIGSALLATSRGGAGADPDNSSLNPGAGGAGGAISLTTSAGSTIAIANNAGVGTVNGITALSAGNDGGIYYVLTPLEGPQAIWGRAGAGGAISLSHSGTITDTTTLTSPFSNSGNLIGIAMASRGGSSVWPSELVQVNTMWTGIPPNTGSGGAISASVASGAVISLQTGNAVGILAVSEPGNGAKAIKPCTYCSLNTSYFGSGGSVSVVNNGSIATGNANSLFSAGILAISSGSDNIIDPFGASNVNVGSFGFGGPVSVSNSGSISSSGSLSVGMAGLSLGAAGIATNAGSGANTLGNNGDYGGSTSSTSAGTTGSVSLSHSGTITTLGDSAFGMVALATPAGGLLRSDINTAFGSGTTSFTAGQSVGNSASPYGANGGSVTVTNSGSITTGSSSGGGNMAIAILGQSIGGGGGSTGGQGAAAFVGDSGGSGGNGGAVSVSSSGTLTTYNDGAIGLLSQSIGGGGGNGGNAAGVFVAVGGQGGLGGSGGTVSVNLGASSSPVGAITTSGDFATGVLAHSVGGGGGNGGYAKSVGLFVSNAIGGAGGGGGSGGAVTFTNTGQPVTTSGNGAHGVLLQSIGGGGGNGGGALSHSVGVIFSDSMALGGSGGSGGAGGSISATSSGAITTSSPDAMGLVAQSIGGGGGNAGSALAKSFAAAGDPQFPTVEFSTAVGGKGGSGGAGGTVNVSTTGALPTAGRCAFGLLAQSIGGGGGNGADSTAGGTVAAGKTGGLQLNTAIGGAGGTASGGGSVSVANASTSATIRTSGSNATALLAQSIGGGGGNGGGGNANSAAPNLAAAGVSAGFVLAISTAVGGSGGGGGGGGGVTVSNVGTITTTGTGAQGLLAQSIGGGGGNGGGGSAAGGGGVVNVNVSVGGKGGSGGSGAAVSVTNSGSISTGETIPTSSTGLGYPVTTGGDGVGILAQSIGGGGGAGGSSDPAGGVSNAALLENLLAGTTPLAYAATLNIGGSGGSGGGGGSVSVSNSGNVQSLGIRAHGVLAQSIGGGGGSGGSVVTQPGTIGNNINADINQWVAPTISANIGLGGSGGVGGSGGAVTIANSGSLVTAGYGAIGLMAQSIGGGGGTGADGSTGMGISIQLGGNGGSGNNGGTLQLGSSSTPLTGTIATIGDDAHALLAQSIGGGGGWASGICSNSASSGFGGLSATRCIGNTSVSADVVPWSPGGALSLNMPGSTGNSGDGGAVSVTLNGAIQTVGERSMGLVAQSIGGGGGFVSGGWNTISNASMLTTNVGQSYATGGSVAVTLGSSGSIGTTGNGAWGLLAQSIGGGGGFMGDPSLALLTPVSNSVPFVSNKDNQYANGGSVTLTLAGMITTTGSNAHGVVAQSIGGGGGGAGGYRYDPSAQVVMGNAYQFNNSTASTSYSGGGNSITINQSGGSINASGAGSIGILAQSTGGITSSDVNPYLITISVAGTVSGGSGSGASGILVSGGGNTSSSPNTITVNSGGLVRSADGVDGTAIQANSGTTNVTIESGGTVTGSVDLGSTPGDMTTNSGGTFNAGSTVVVAANTFTNAGNLIPFGPGRIGTTTISGGFAQTASGVLGVDINSLETQSSDQLVVNGQARVGGTIAPVATALLPGRLPVVQATTLSSTAKVRDGIAFGWQPSVRDNTLYVTPQPTLRPAGFAISPSQKSLTHYLERAWQNSDRSLAPTFAYLSQLSNGNQYQQALRAFAPQPHTVQLQNLLLTAPLALGSAIECPADLSTSVLQTQTNCVWARGAGTWARQSAKDGDPGSSLTGASTWLGGQLQLAPGWFLGGAFGYGQSWADATNFTSHGEVYNGSLTLRRVYKAWSFSGSLAIGAGDFDNTRSYSLPSAGTLPGSSATYTSHVSPWLIGGRLRAAYVLPLNTFYLRPYLDLDLLHAQLPGFSESGSDGLPLAFRASQKTAFQVSPMLEFGGQRQLDSHTTLRPYLALGMNIRPDFNWVINSRFRDAGSGNGTFRLYGNAPDVLARLNVGLQVLRSNGFEVRLEYDLSAGDGYAAQVPSARLTYRF